MGKLGRSGRRDRAVWIGLIVIAAAGLLILCYRYDPTRPALVPPGQVRTWQPATAALLPAGTAPHADAREAMARVIRDTYGLRDEGVLNIMRAVPRHEFVPASMLDSAYADSPLPIGYGQTISQPYIVAEMTRQLRLRPDSRVLEIGTGSGYQAAVLAHLAKEVYSIEIVAPLAESAARRLRRLGYAVHIRNADGYHGWPEKAPFDAIIVTCAAGEIPPPLLAQLAPGGRMVIPVGGHFATQSLMLVEKDADGKVATRSLMAVRFVPFVRAAGRDD